MLRHGVVRVFVSFCVLVNYGPFCSGALKLHIYIIYKKNAGAFGLTAFFSGHIYSTTLQYNWNGYDVNYLRRQRSVRPISLHCLTPACWCHRTGMSAISASIAAPSSAGSRRSHAASPTPSRGSPPRCVRPCRSAPLKYGRWRRPSGRKLRQQYNYRFCLYIYMYLWVIFSKWHSIDNKIDVYIYFIYFLL